jgi:hypothetical protein
MMTDRGDLIARALIILAEENEAWRARRGLDLAPERPVNCPSCEFVNKRPCVFAEAAAAEPSLTSGLWPVSSTGECKN